jgi:hypothetical protein
MSASITAIQSFNYNVSTTQFVTVGPVSLSTQSMQSTNQSINQSINQSVITKAQEKTQESNALAQTASRRFHFSDL